MATTKKKSTKKASKAQSQSLPARTARTMRDRPYTSAAIATGAAAVVGAIAGLFMLKKSGKTVGEVADDVSAKVKKEAAAAQKTVKQGVKEVKAKAKEFSNRRKDGVDPDPARSQNEIMEEAITLKKTGEMLDKKSKTDIKTGAIAY